MKIRAGKTILIIVIPVVAILFAAVIFFQRYLPPLLEERMTAELSKILSREIPDLYTVKAEGTTISNSLRNVQLDNLSINLSPEAIEAHPADELPQILFNITVSGIQITTNGLIDLARGRSEVGFRAVGLGKVNAEIWTNPEGSTPEREESTSPILSALEIGMFEADSVSLSHYSFPDSTLQTAATGISISTKAKWEAEKEDHKMQFHLSDYKIMVEQVDFTPSQDLYSYHILSLSHTEEQNLIAIDEIRISPLYGKREMSRHITHQTDRIDSRIRQIEIHAPDIPKLINEQIFTAKELVIGSSQTGVFRDRNLPLDTERRPPMPTRRIREAPLAFHINLIELKNSEVTYSELPQNGGTEGVVPFTALSARLTNITNLEDSLKKDSILRIAAGSIVFGETQLSADFTYNLMDINGGYTAKGQLRSLDLRAINPALEPLTGIKVSKGNHHRSDFHFSGNDSKTTGKLTMLYDELELELEQDRSRIRQAIVGWLGRNLIYYPSNPDNRNGERIADIEFERDPSRFVFHYWWQSYLSGIRNTVVRSNTIIGLSDSQ